MPVETFTFLPEQICRRPDGSPLLFDLYQCAEPVAPQAVIVWLPQAASDHAPQRQPCPIAHWLGYGYTIISLESTVAHARDDDLLALCAHLREQAQTLCVDANNIGALRPSDSGYEATLLMRDGERSYQRRPLFVIDETDFHALRAETQVRILTGFFTDHLHGGHYDPDFDPLVLRTPDTAWFDPVMLPTTDTQYRLFPTPSRGPGTFGSYLIHLPHDYAHCTRHYPVLYYLHGGQGNQREVRKLLPAMLRAMHRGKMPQAIVVSPQALPIGWYANAEREVDGVVSGPVENVVAHDLVNHIDATWRTIPTSAGRALEGWSMGGFGALRLGFKYPQRFGAVSSLGGAVISWQDEHNMGYLTNTFGPDTVESIARFDNVHPAAWAARNADLIRNRVRVRVLVGDQDWLYHDNGKAITDRFSMRLETLGIPHDYTVLPGLGHDLPDAIASGTLRYPSDFWNEAFDPRR